MSSSSSSSDSGEDELITNLLVEELNSNSGYEVLQHALDVASSSSRNHRHNKRRSINRRRELAEERIIQDYFVDSPTYTDAQFRRRFRMRRHLFLRIVNDLENQYSFFKTRVDAIGRRSFSPIHRCTAVLRLLAYGCSADMLDETVRMGESTLLSSLRKFAKGIREIYGDTYLRRPNDQDIARLLRIGQNRGFPGMLGSIDCMHWEWRNCPTAWAGQYTRGDIKKPTIILEAVASQDLWIWHAFYGVAGSNNDINVLNQSPLFAEHLREENSAVQFQVNGREYNLGYYLADGIYPRWATLVKTITLPQGEKEQLFAKSQESVRKDVERAFGVLQARFAIIRGPATIHDEATLTDIMYACIILHNMIVEDERDEYNVRYDYEPLEGVPPPTMEDVRPGPGSNEPVNCRIDRISQINASIRDRTVHHQLQSDLIEHIWQKFGGT